MADVTTISLFTGIGGLDLGVARALGRLGIQARTLAYVEREAYCCNILASRIAEGQLPRAPICTNVEELAGVGPADLVIGGFPCQDISVAGNQAGLGGERSGLWWEMLRVVDAVDASLVFVENVSGLLADRTMEGVVGGLAALGFVGRWRCVRASDVGAPHRRERVFLLAYRRGDGESVADPGRGAAQRRPDARGEGAQEGAGACEGLQRKRGRGAAGVPGEGVGFPHAWPPSPDDEDGWYECLLRRPDLAPALAPFRRVADGVPAGLDAAMSNRVDRLRALGNAVVPAQAEAAFLDLWGDQ